MRLVVTAERNVKNLSQIKELTFCMVTNDRRPHDNNNPRLKDGCIIFFYKIATYTYVAYCVGTYDSNLKRIEMHAEMLQLIEVRPLTSEDKVTMTFEGDE
jgi:hypothetical protein